MVSSNNNDNYNGNGDPDYSRENVIIPNDVAGFSSRASNGDHGELLIKADDFQTDGASDGSNGQYRRRSTRYEHPLWNLGWTDGRLGQPGDTNEDLIIAHGRARKEDKIQRLEALVAGRTVLLAATEERLNALRERLRDARDRYKQILTDRAGRFHEFSYSLAIFYLLIATVLFISDVPLTLKLVARGFDLKTVVRDPNTNQILYGIDDLLLKGPKIVLQLWEPLALAFGIALAGVFIKVFLDDVIFRDTSERPKKITRAFLVIMCFLLMTVVALGIFRATVQTQLQEEERQTTAATIRQRLQGIPSTEVESIIASLPDNKESWLTIVTFTALTLTLPLVAGACFSAGWRRLKDTQLYRQSKRQLGKLERAIQKESENLSKISETLSRAKAWLVRNQSEGALMDAETEQELNLYRHGYLRGITLPETIDFGEGFYKRIQKSANRIMAEQLRERIWENIKDSRGL